MRFVYRKVTARGWCQSESRFEHLPIEILVQTSDAASVFELQFLFSADWGEKFASNAFLAACDLDFAAKRLAPLFAR